MRKVSTMSYQFKAHFVKTLNTISIQLITRGLTVENSAELTRIGTNYGGYWVPKVALRADSFPKKAISGGLGGDISFDLELIKHGWKIIGIEPDGSSIDWIASLEIPESQFELIQARLVGEVGNALEEVSLNELIDFQGEISLVKLDIEGTEIEVFRSTLADKEKITPWVILELDYISKISVISVIERIKKFSTTRAFLKEMYFEGYRIMKIEGFNFHWGHKDNKEIMKGMRNVNSREKNER